MWCLSIVVEEHSVASEKNVQSNRSMGESLLEPQFNEPLNDEVLGITNDILQPQPFKMKMELEQNLDLTNQSTLRYKICFFVTCVVKLRSHCKGRGSAGSGLAKSSWCTYSLLHWLGMEVPKLMRVMLAFHKVKVTLRWTTRSTVRVIKQNYILVVQEIKRR